jgi:hypothetical protein
MNINYNDNDNNNTTSNNNNSVYEGTKYRNNNNYHKKNDNYHNNHNNNKSITNIEDHYTCDSTQGLGRIKCIPGGVFSSEFWGEARGADSPTEVFICTFAGQVLAFLFFLPAMACI